MQVTVSKDELYSLIKDAIREVIDEKGIEHIIHSLPVISDEESREIEQLYGSPEQYNDIASEETLDL